MQCQKMGQNNFYSTACKLSYMHLNDAIPERLNTSHIESLQDGYGVFYSDSRDCRSSDITCPCRSRDLSNAITIPSSIITI